MQEEKNKLNVVELIKLVDTYAPAVEFEPSIFFGAEKDVLAGIGVCVDPTIDVMKEAQAKGIDMIVSHHYPSKRSKEYASMNGLYCMVAHLRQDVAEEGNIQTFAEIIGIKNIKPFTIRYKGMVVPRGAVTGDFGETDFYCPSVNTGFNNPTKLDKPIPIVVTLDGYMEQMFRTLEHYCGIKPKIKAVVGNTKDVIRRVGVSAGAAIKAEFLEQIAEERIDTYVAAEMEQPAIMVAKELGITLIDVGHYETEVPGMQRLAKAIGAEFIPNNYLFK